MFKTDTIAGVSTATATAAIGIVRLSGGRAIDIVRGIFSGDKTFACHTLTYGCIMRGKDVLDEVLVSVMRAPRSYTREDVVEINCHGGSACVRAVLELTLENGARLAEPGEFTKRAFMNGRIDLTQAEAVMDLIAAKTELSRGAAAARLTGRLGGEVARLRNEILGLVANIETSIDYPEHDMERLNLEQIRVTGSAILSAIERLLQSARHGRLYKDGIETVIVGRPNVGKSSLLNALLNENRAIVTDIPGTTRDILYDYVDIGLPLRIADTAGLRKSDDILERLGVEKTHEAIQAAQLILFMLDGPPVIADWEILEMLAGKRVIVLVNKSDLRNEPMAELFSSAREMFFDYAQADISAMTGDGLWELCDTIRKMFVGDFGREDELVIFGMRQQAALDAAAERIRSALDTIEAGFTEDLVSVDLQAAYAHLGEITGETLGEDVIDRIFSEFCLGK